MYMYIFMCDEEDYCCSFDSHQSTAPLFDLVVCSLPKGYHHHTTMQRAIRISSLPRSTLQKCLCTSGAEWFSRRQISQQSSVGSFAMVRQPCTTPRYVMRGRAWETERLGIRTRYFGNESIEDMELIEMRETSNRIVDVPVGDFHMGLWMEADNVLKWWASQRTTESVETSFELLDRLVEELKAELKGATSEEAPQDLITRFEARDIITTMLESWFEVWRENAEEGLTLPLKITPQLLVERMDRYAEELPWAEAFQLMGRSLGDIFTATMLRPRPYSETAPFATHLLERLMYTLNESSKLEPYKVNTTLDLWAKSDRKDKAERAEAIVSMASDRRVKMEIITYNTLLNVYAQQGLADEAEKLLQALIHNYLHSESPENTPKPDKISFDAVAMAFANSNMGMEAGDRVSFMIKRMFDPLDDFGRIEVEVTTGLFNVAILAYSRTGVLEGADEAFRTLQDMKRSELTAPDVISYGTVIDAYKKCGRPDKAEAVFQEQLALFSETKDESVRPNTTTMTMLIQAHANSPLDRKIEHELELLQWMLQLVSDGVLLETPDAWTYNAIVNSIISTEKSPKTVERVLRILSIMKRRALAGDENAKPNAWVYTQIILLFLDMNDLQKAASIMKEVHKDPSVDLDLRTYSKFIHALAKNGQTRHAVDWFHKLLDLYEEKGSQDGLRPGTRLLGGVVGGLKRFARRNDRKALADMMLIVHRYEKLVKNGSLKEPPDARVYRTLLFQTVKTSPVQNKATIVLELLHKLRNHDDNLRQLPVAPVLVVLIEEGKMDAATDLLHLLIDEFEDPRASSLNAKCVRLVLEGWSQRANKHAWEEAIKIFRRLEDPSRRALINRESYASMINLANKLSLESEAKKLGEAMKGSQLAVSENPGVRRSS